MSKVNSAWIDTNESEDFGEDEHRIYRSVHTTMDLNGAWQTSQDDDTIYIYPGGTSEAKITITNTSPEDTIQFDVDGTTISQNPVSATRPQNDADAALMLYNQLRSHFKLNIWPESITVDGNVLTIRGGKGTMPTISDLSIDDAGGDLSVVIEQGTAYDYTCKTPVHEILYPSSSYISFIKIINSSEVRLFDVNDNQIMDAVNGTFDSATQSITWGEVAVWKPWRFWELPLTTLPKDSTSYTDTAAADGATTSYRVSAFRAEPKDATITASDKIIARYACDEATDAPAFLTDSGPNGYHLSDPIYTGVGLGAGGGMPGRIKGKSGFAAAFTSELAKSGNYNTAGNGYSYRGCSSLDGLDFKNALTDSFTMCFWVRASGVGEATISPNSYTGIMRIADAFGYVDSWIDFSRWANYMNGPAQGGADTLTIRIGETTDNTEDHIMHIEGFVYDVWHHVAISYNNPTSTWQTYFNGIPSGVTGVGTAVTDGSWTGPRGAMGGDRFAVGGAGGSYFHGFLDDIRFYNDALSSADITSIYDGDSTDGGTEKFSTTGEITTTTPPLLSEQDVINLGGGAPGFFWFDASIDPSLLDTAPYTWDAGSPYGTLTEARVLSVPNKMADLRAAESALKLYASATSGAFVRTKTSPHPDLYQGLNGHNYLLMDRLYDVNGVAGPYGSLSGLGDSNIDKPPFTEFIVIEYYVHGQYIFGAPWGGNAVSGFYHNYQVPGGYPHNDDLNIRLDGSDVGYVGEEDYQVSNNLVVTNDPIRNIQGSGNSRLIVFSSSLGLYDLPGKDHPVKIWSNNYEHSVERYNFSASTTTAVEPYDSFTWGNWHTYPFAYGGKYGRFYEMLRMPYVLPDGDRVDVVNYFIDKYTNPAKAV